MQVKITALRSAIAFIYSGGSILENNWVLEAKQMLLLQVLMFCGAAY
ncbi:hypothetical protein H6G80_06490 [Nostoc sp. FACHB-87]|nr:MULTISPECIES: hypothetical protein [Nostocales]MBD2300484.1 hypothetical protein [Nostoc sp. FACHB-190]MBD2453723.1 hypothetical protein [Nostoc sp. FACHB-87]MBD2475321.1 hypothetical protein [Anabaena sp. FACHB-83]MBD2488894.1 hypothetical protein [Aulosira sp. FACHB-615]